MFLKVQASDKIILKFLNNVLNAYISTNIGIGTQFCVISVQPQIDRFERRILPQA